MQPLVRPSSVNTSDEGKLRLLQATLIVVCLALRQQACDQDEELALVLEQHGIRVLDELLAQPAAPRPASARPEAPRPGARRSSARRPPVRR